MSKEWNEPLFQKWINLRQTFRTRKKNKNWNGVIEVCREIVQLDSQAKFIEIMTPIFYKEIANAFHKLNDIDNSLKYYQLARSDFIRYRESNTLRDPTDWLNEIKIIEKKIEKLGRS